MLGVQDIKDSVRCNQIRMDAPFSVWQVMDGTSSGYAEDKHAKELYDTGHGVFNIDSIAYEASMMVRC